MRCVPSLSLTVFALVWHKIFNCLRSQPSYPGSHNFVYCAECAVGEHLTPKGTAGPLCSELEPGPQPDPSPPEPEPQPQPPHQSQNQAHQNRRRRHQDRQTRSRNHNHRNQSQNQARHTRQDRRPVSAVAIQSLAASTSATIAATAFLAPRSHTQTACGATARTRATPEILASTRRLSVVTPHAFRCASMRGSVSHSPKHWGGATAAALATVAKRVGPLALVAFQPRGSTHAL